MAEVGTVYDLTPAPHTADVLATGEPRTAAARTANKWLTASLVDDTAEGPGRGVSRTRPDSIRLPGVSSRRVGILVHPSIGLEIVLVMRRRAMRRCPMPTTAHTSRANTGRL